MDLIPGTQKTIDMVPDNVGQWLFHCHTNMHMMAVLFLLTFPFLDAF